jgi:hypothetical protein
MLAPWGERVRIDRGIVKLIGLIWSLDIKTLFSCENHEGRVYVGVPDGETAARFWRAGNYAGYPDYWEEARLARSLTLISKTVVQVERELGCAPGLTMRYAWNWQFFVVREDLVYCQFPVEQLAKVESSLILAADSCFIYARRRQNKIAGRIGDNQSQHSRASRFPGTRRR